MKKADFILIGAVAAVVGVLLIILYASGNNTGAYVQIEADGKIIQTLPLDEDTQYEITTDDGTNTLVISDNTAKMTRADCPDGICVSHMAISRNGESIICLPHKVVVTVVKNAESDDVDAVA